MAQPGLIAANAALVSGSYSLAKAPACDMPSHSALHVRPQTKSTNGVS